MRYLYRDFVRNHISTHVTVCRLCKRQLAKGRTTNHGIYVCICETERAGEAKPSEQVTKATGSQMIGPKSSEGQQRQQQQKNCDQKYADSRRVIPLSTTTTTTTALQTDDAASLWRSSNYDDVATKQGRQKKQQENQYYMGYYMYSTYIYCTPYSLYSRDLVTVFPN